MPVESSSYLSTDRARRGTAAGVAWASRPVTRIGSSILGVACHGKRGEWGVCVSRTLGPRGKSCPHFSTTISTGESQTTHPFYTRFLRRVRSSGGRPPAAPQAGCGVPRPSQAPHTRNGGRRAEAGPVGKRRREGSTRQRRTARPLPRWSRCWWWLPRRLAAGGRGSRGAICVSSR